MLSDTPVAVDRGGYRDTVTPWAEPARRAEVLARVRAGFTAHGLRPTGRWRVRPRPWWVLLRLDVEEHGAVWFKANPPAGAFEGGLTAALARWVPGHVLEPLAVDTGRGWSLLPDGGPLLRDVLPREAVAPGAWEELARQSAAVQHAWRRTPETSRASASPPCPPPRCPASSTGSTTPRRRAGSGPRCGNCACAPA